MYPGTQGHNERMKYNTILQIMLNRSKKITIGTFRNNKQELMWTCDKLQWTDKHIQALKLEKIV